MPRDSKVQNLIDKVRETYNLKPFDGSEPLEITIKYHSTVLKPQWRLTDIGINEGSILHVEVEPVTTPLLEIKTSIKMNKFRCIKLLTNEDFKTEKGLNSTVAEVKGLAVTTNGSLQRVLGVGILGKLLFHRATKLKF